MTKRLTKYGKMQKTSPWKIGDELIVSRRADEGEMGWKTIEACHPDDENDYDEDVDHSHEPVVGKKVTVKDIHPNCIWVTSDTDDHSPTYWAVPFFILKKRPIYIKMDHRDYEVLFHPDEIKIGCSRIHHDDVREIFNRCFSGEG